MGTAGGVDQQPATRNARGAVVFAAGGAMISIVFCPAPKVCVPASNNTVVLPVVVSRICDDPAGTLTVDADAVPAATLETVALPRGAPGAVT